MIAALLITAAHAAPERSWTIQVDPLTAALGFVHVQVERVLAPAWSLYLGPHLRLYDAPWSSDPEPFLGAGAEAGLRWYPQGHAPTGWWVLTRGVAARTWTTETPRVTGFGGYGSLLGGRTLILGDRWVLSGGAGVNLLAYGVDGYGTYGVWPALHTAVGVAL